MTFIEREAISSEETKWAGFKGRSSASLRICVLMILLASVVLNVLLAHQLSKLDHQSLHGMQPGLHVGVAVPPIKATKVNGQSDTIVYSDTTQPTVLYIFSPECIWCARNLNNLKALLAASVGHQRFLGISLSREGLNKYLATNQLNMPIYTSVSDKTVKAYQLGATPQTIVVSPSGRVMKNWPGAWSGQLRTDVESYFHVTLPGLDMSASERQAREQH